MLVLVLGDSCVPLRAPCIPLQFREMLKPGKMQHILCTGNLDSPQTAEYLRTIAADLHVVRGDVDFNSRYPEQKIVTIGSYKVGLCHGHDLSGDGGTDRELRQLRRRIGCDILITGCTPTFRSYVDPIDDCLIIQPGRAAGGYGIDAAPPSFALLDVRVDHVMVFGYTLNRDTGKVDIRKMKWPSNPAQTTSTNPATVEPNVTSEQVTA